MFSSRVTSKRRRAAPSPTRGPGPVPGDPSAGGAKPPPTPVADARDGARGAAFFDMDRTLLRVDSGMAWMRFLRRRGEASRRKMAKAAYWSALYELAILDMEGLADRLAGELAGRSELEMIEKCRAFYRAEIAHAVSPAALRAIRVHRARGELVALLTGSTQYVADAVADAVGLGHALSSRVEVAAGQFTGRMTHYGFGTHKVALAEAFSREHGVDLGASWFYSDSFNDLPMLERVGRAVAVNPDARLRRHARRRSWPIALWR